MNSARSSFFADELQPRISPAAMAFAKLSRVPTTHQRCKANERCLGMSNDALSVSSSLCSTRSA